MNSELKEENKLVKQLMENGYKYIDLNNINIFDNLKIQIENINKEKLNGEQLTDDQFKVIKNELFKCQTDIERYKKIRDYITIEKNGLNINIRLIDKDNLINNTFQVTNQMEVQGRKKNRYDINILLNGIPIIQIELKRIDVELKQAFGQTKRYKKDSFSAYEGILNFIEIFVISNIENTRYYVNSDKELDFKETIEWKDELNKKVHNIFEFADVFLKRGFLIDYVLNYIVDEKTSKKIKLMRPYQYHAIKAVILNTETKNSYIWHTTGSGKTLTSYKLAEYLKRDDSICKIIFTVDRRDLDKQTVAEFNEVSVDDITRTSSTVHLVKQLTSQKNEDKLIVTTIQKLQRILSIKDIEYLRDEKVVFIFDECHRSQFGDIHKRLKKFFKKNEMIGFTGTPIFKENAIKGDENNTTAALFDKCVHKYTINNAIADKSVLGFAVEILNTLKPKEEIIDKDVVNINISELYNSPKRINVIVDKIIEMHDQKTHNKRFNAILCVDSIDTLIAYYNQFKKTNHNFKIFATYTNSKDLDYAGVFEEGELNNTEALEVIIDDFNKEFNTGFKIETIGQYNDNLTDKFKANKFDILIVVNMFLTGFNSPITNTLYVDKNLSYHGLIQAFSRTNRNFGLEKEYGSIVCFRNLEKEINAAVALFSNGEDESGFLYKTFKEKALEFNEKIKDFKIKFKDPDYVHDIKSENEKKEFVKMFRDIYRDLNSMKPMSEFKFSELGISEDDFNRFNSIYLDIYTVEKNKQYADKESILDDFDFEIERISYILIDYDYINNLLKSLSELNVEDIDKEIEKVGNKLRGENILKSKVELIEKFLNDNLVHNHGIGFEDYVDKNFKDELDIFKENDFEDNEILTIEGYIKNAINGYGGNSDTNEYIDSIVKKQNNKAGIIWIVKSKTLKEKVIELVDKFKGWIF